MQKLKKGAQAPAPVAVTDPATLLTADQLARIRLAHPALGDAELCAEILRVRAQRQAARSAELTHVRSLCPPSDPSNAPAERWQRGSEPLEVPRAPGDRRPVQRSDSGLAQLRRAKKIGDAEVTGADRFRSDYELGVHGARDPEKSGSGGGVDGYNISAIDALTRFSKASAAVGRFGSSLLVAFVCEGMSINAISQDAARAGWSRQDLVGAVVATLTRLTEHYETVDSTKPGQLPPWEASRVAAERRAA